MSFEKDKQNSKEFCSEKSNWLSHKQNALSKKDLSFKGCIDKRIKPLINLINSKNNYYTSSSCSGRILLLRLAEEDVKKESEWLFVSHEKIDASDIICALKNLPKEEIWFKMEPIILHICCKTVNDAAEVVDKANKVGLKHSGINSLRKKIVVEIYGNERIETIIANHKKLLVDETYLKSLAEIANKKLELTHRKIEQLHNLFKQMQDSELYYEA